MLEILRRQIAEKRSLMEGIVNSCRTGTTTRDMTPDESTKFDDLMAQVQKLQDRVTALEAIEDDEPAEPRSRGIRSLPPGHPPAIGRGREDQRPYSVMRAIRLAVEGRPLDGLEGEVHQEIVRRSGGRAFKGFAMPTSSDPETLRMMHPGVDFERRDLTTVTGIGSIFNVPKSFVELLRARLTIEALGANIMTDMHGNFSLPRQTAGNTVQWVGEGASITPTNPTFDQIPFTPHLAIASTVITKMFMMQTSIDAEMRVQNDLAKVLALEFDRVIIMGSSGAQPTGLLNNTIIQGLSAGLVAAGGNGGPLTYASAVAMETTIATANADAGKIAYLINPTIRGSLKQTFVGTAGYPLFVYGKGSAPDVGEINGYPTRTTTLMPTALTKGSSTNCNAIIFGNWGDLTVAMWDTGVDVIIDPYTGKRSGAIEITMEMAMDSHPEHEASFAIRQDVTP